MTFRVQHVEGEYRVVLSAEAMEALHLTDGAEVDVKLVSAAPRAQNRHATLEEGVAAYLRTEPLPMHTYRELAK